MKFEDFNYCSFHLAASAAVESQETIYLQIYGGFSLRDSQGKYTG